MDHQVELLAQRRRCWLETILVKWSRRAPWWQTAFCVALCVASVAEILAALYGPWVSGGVLLTDEPQSPNEAQLFVRVWLRSLQVCGAANSSHPLQCETWNADVMQKATGLACVADAPGWFSSMFLSVFCHAGALVLRIMLIRQRRQYSSATVPPFCLLLGLFLIIGLGVHAGLLYYWTACPPSHWQFEWGFYLSSIAAIPDTTFLLDCLSIILPSLCVS